MTRFKAFRSAVCASLCLMGAGLSSALAAPTYNVTFSQSGFSGGAAITGSFTGTDADGDGWLNSFAAGEIFTFSMSFSGNLLVGSFSHTHLDFAPAGSTGGLVFKLGTSLLGDDTALPAEGIASGPISGGGPFPLPPATLFGYRTGYGPTGLTVPFGFVEDNTAFGMANPLGNIDHTSSWVAITSVTVVPEPETYAMLLAGLGLLGFAARRRKLKLAA